MDRDAGMFDLRAQEPDIPASGSRAGGAGSDGDGARPWRERHRVEIVSRGTSPGDPGTGDGAPSPELYGGSASYKSPQLIETARTENRAGRIVRGNAPGRRSTWGTDRRQPGAEETFVPRRTTPLPRGAERRIPVSRDAERTTPVPRGAERRVPVSRGAERGTPVPRETEAARPVPRTTVRRGSTRTGGVGQGGRRPDYADYDVFAPDQEEQSSYDDYSLYDDSLFPEADPENEGEETSLTSAQRRRRRARERQQRERQLRGMYIKAGVAAALVLILLILVLPRTLFKKADSTAAADGKTLSAQAQADTSAGQNAETLESDPDTEEDAGQDSGENKEQTDPDKTAADTEKQTADAEKGNEQAAEEGSGTGDSPARSDKEDAGAEDPADQSDREDGGAEDPAGQPDQEDAAAEDPAGQSDQENGSAEDPAGQTDQENTAAEDPSAVPGGNTGGTAGKAGKDEKTAEDLTQTYAHQDDWRLILVNTSHPLPEGHSIETSVLTNGEQVDSRCYNDLTRMLSDCAAQDGCVPVVCSAYRSHDYQVSLYEAQVQKELASGKSQKEAEAAAGTTVAVPGTSEHELGLAVDLCDFSYQNLDDAQADTPTQQWLMAHCWDYGFILRYPKDKSDITGIIYEPWHYRYVGLEASKAMQQSGQCLEEYLQTN